MAFGIFKQPVREKGKFFVGDKVRCINGPTKGSGWRLDKVFTVYKVNESVHSGQQLLWPSIGDGIYSDSVELVKGI